MGFISLFIHFYFVFIPFWGTEKRFVTGGDEGRSSWLLGLSSHQAPFQACLITPLLFTTLFTLLSFSILFIIIFHLIYYIIII